MTALPREAREGLMRAWLELLKDHHPGVNWIPASPEAKTPAQTKNTKENAI